MPIIQSISRYLQSMQQPFIVILNINHQKKFIQKNINPLLDEAQKASPKMAGTASP